MNNKRVSKTIAARRAAIERMEEILDRMAEKGNKVAEAELDSLVDEATDHARHGIK